MSSSLGVKMSLPAGTLQSRREEELKRRKEKEQQQQNNEQQSAPRRLAPQRKKKTPPSPSDPAPAAAVSQDREHIPISIPINVHDDDYDNVNGELNNQDDDTSDQMNNITNNVADWTLSNADEKIRNYVNDNNDDEDEEEEQSYHGEIESVEDDNESNNERDNAIEEESVDDGGYKVISEDDVPLDPPPLSMPMVLVDLEMLCGVVPYDEEEKQEVVTQLMEMLMGSVQEEGGDNDNDQEDDKPQTLQDLTKGDGLSLDFDERVVELFESGVARHVDSMMPAAIACVDKEKKVANEATDSIGKNAVYPFALIPYPEFLSSEISPTSRSTIRLWKLLNNTHESPLLTRLFAHLRNTSRSLLWKADMHQELCSLARQEYKAQIKRQQMIEYNEWKETVRKERLEKLYDVRETFQLRVDVARRKHESFVEERELRVERELKRRGLHQYRITSRQYTEDSAKDGEEYYDEDGWGGAVDEEEIFGDEIDYIDESSHDEANEWSPLGLKIAINTPEDSLEEVRKAKEELRNNKNLKQLEPITHSDNQNRKSERSQRLKDQTSSTNNSFFEKQEAAIRESLKTNEERIAEAVLSNLEGKLQSVDELLETLQEEEWADEEGDENNQLSLGEGMGEEIGEVTEMTLLDQILAMILGALPKESSGATDEKEHFAFVKEEHASIISSWKETFGRLPPFPSSEPEPNESQEAMSRMSETLDNLFGDPMLSTNLNSNDWATDNTDDKIALIGNETSAWDEIDDWDAFFPSK